MVLVYSVPPLPTSSPTCGRRSLLSDQRLALYTGITLDAATLLLAAANAQYARRGRRAAAVDVVALSTSHAVADALRARCPAPSAQPALYVDVGDGCLREAGGAAEAFAYVVRDELRLGSLVWIVDGTRDDGTTFMKPRARADKERTAGLRFMRRAAAPAPAPAGGQPRSPATARGVIMLHFRAEAGAPVLSRRGAQAVEANSNNPLGSEEAAHDVTPFFL
eukprot:m51a1_g2879 hypothetical protein (221) ;mRNA; f:389011-389673